MPPAHPPPSLSSAPTTQDPLGLLLFFYPILLSLFFPFFFPFYSLSSSAILPGKGAPGQEQVGGQPCPPLLLPPQDRAPQADRAIQALVTRW